MTDVTQREENGRGKVGDLFGGLLFAALGVFAIGAAVGMPRRGELGFVTSPGFTPLLLGTAILILSVVMVVKALRAGAIREIGNWFRTIRKSQESRRVLVLTGLLTAYVAAIGYLNFALVTFLFITATFFYVRAGKPWQILIYAAVATGLVAYFIPYIFTMPLP
ncbi:tripartite tricarboxylate transporter TctB family protein [Rubrobacter taiwanensis]|nr:tripartite tricarboxylate transporter TctB family protein [Rubrobacter taiwanensis]